jgi:predicted RNase H-like HicB family nuclease
VALVPSLPGCHTQANSLDLLMEQIRETIELYAEVEWQPAAALGFVGIQQMTIAA